MLLPLSSYRVIAALAGKRMVSVACGSLHTLLLSDAGEVFSCGLGDYGQLGHGHTEAEPAPRRERPRVGKNFQLLAEGLLEVLRQRVAELSERRGGLAWQRRCLGRARATGRVCRLGRGPPLRLWGLAEVWRRVR